MNFSYEIYDTFEAYKDNTHQLNGTSHFSSEPYIYIQLPISLALCRELNLILNMKPSYLFFAHFSLMQLSGNCGNEISWQTGFASRQQK